MGATDFGSSEAGKLGGKARAESLTPEERSEIARRAVEARWKKAGKDVKRIPRATHVGVLKFGDLEIPCAVLEDGTRVLSQRGVTRALTGAKTASGSHYERTKDDGDAQLPPFVSANNIKSYINKDLTASLMMPKEYLPEHGGRSAYGLDATLIPQVLSVWLDARAANALRPNQLHIAAKAEILVRGLANVGIIALVDEATGYQDDRARDALAKILEAFVAKEIQKWVSTFSAEYYKQLCRLWGVPFNGSLKRPQFFGTLTNNLVYARLAPGVLRALREKNPMTDRGYRQHKHFQWLTNDSGYLALKEHLSAVTALMTVAPDKGKFLDMIDVVKPKYKELPLFEDAKA